MQALWSRAARKPATCKCIQCLSRTAAVAARTRSTGLRGAWAFGTPTSTFAYTAVFAAGIAIDAKAKQTRNEQWDAALTHLREELEKPDTPALLSKVKHTRPSVEQAYFIHGKDRPIEDVLVDDESLPNPDFMPLGDVWPEGVDWKFIHRTAGMDLVEDPVLLERESLVQIAGTEVTERLWKLMPFDSRFPGSQALEWPVNTGPDLKRINLPPQSLWSVDSLRHKALRNRHTRKKIVLQELSMGWLIHQLISQAQCNKLSEDALRSLSEPIQDIARLSTVASLQIRRKISDHTSWIDGFASEVELPSEQIVQARARRIPSRIPTYRQDDDGDFLQTAQAMNAALQDLLFQTKEDRSALALTVAKVCHNLLISSAPPDVQTFNILITGLKRWNLHHMTRSVIESFYHCHIRPNELTCATILDHYIQTNNPKEFSRFVALMRGANGALMLARPDININEAGESRLVRVDEKTVYQKVYPTPMVFNMLILGALRFAGFDRAMEIYYEMKEDGWGLDIAGLGQLLVDCIDKADWDGGLYVWEEIKQIRDKAKEFHVSGAYANMLSLASITGNASAFRQLLDEARARGLNGRKILESATVTLKKVKDRRPPALWAADHVMMALLNYRDNVVPKNDVPEEIRNADPATAQHLTISDALGAPTAHPPEAVWTTHEKTASRRETRDEKRRRRQTELEEDNVAIEWLDQHSE